MRRVVQKRAEDADRRKHEAVEKAKEDAARQEEKEALAKTKADDIQRLSREAKVFLLPPFT